MLGSNIGTMRGLMAFITHQVRCVHHIAEDGKPFRLSIGFVDKYRTKTPPFGFNGLGELVYKRTYARMKEGNVNEEWFETVERVVNGTYNMQKRWVEQNRLGWNAWHAQRSAQEMYARIFDMKFLPPGRGLWAMGSPITEERGLYTALNNCAFVSTENLKEDGAKPFTFLMDASMLGVGVGFDTKGANTFAIKGPNSTKREEVYTIADSREGWVESVKLLLESYFHRTSPISFDYSLIRPAGLPIKGFGGTSSGPEPLQLLHVDIRKTLDRELGQNISITAIVDIMNHIGKCVVAGNVRRTAEIAFGDPESSEYVNLKNYTVNPSREAFGWTSNNSVFAQLGMDYTATANTIAHNGEPGYAWLENMQSYSRMNGQADEKDFRARGGNPCLEQTLESYELCCVSGDTRILTKNGYPRISDVVDQPVQVWNGQSWSEVIPFIAARNKVLYRVTLSDGSVLDCTGDHGWSIMTPHGTKRMETCELSMGAQIEGFSLPETFPLSGGDGGKAISMNESGIANHVFELPLSALHELLRNTFVTSCINGSEGVIRDLQLLLRRVGVSNVQIRKISSDLWQCEIMQANHSQTIMSIQPLEGLHTTFCFSEPERHMGVFGNVLTYQCLVETFPHRHDSLEDFQRTLKFAYLYAKTVTCGQTHWPETNRVMLRNRRIGCSMSGIAQFISTRGLHELRHWCLNGYRSIQQYDKTYSDWLAIPRSIKTTSIKPSGTVSLLAGATPGMHFPESRYYIRRVRLSKTSHLLPSLQEANFDIEDAVFDKNTVVVSIPIDSGQNIRTAKELSMWEQLSLAAFLQRYWADNQVSCTVVFDPETEGNHIKHALDYFQYQLKGVSFLPRLEHGAFEQMPYEEISQDLYTEMVNKLKRIDFSQVASLSNPAPEKFCDTSGCTHSVFEDYEERECYEWLQRTLQEELHGKDKSAEEIKDFGMYAKGT